MNLAQALAAEIARVSNIRGKNMTFRAFREANRHAETEYALLFDMMLRHIDEGVAAIGSGDAEEMQKALQKLKGY